MRRGSTLSFRGRTRPRQQNNFYGGGDASCTHNFGDTNGFRRRMREKLEAFANSEESELKLEPMTSDERRNTHIIARKLDLRSVSHGKEPQRYMIIKRSGTRGGLFSCLSSMNETQSLSLHPDQMLAIRDFIGEFPVEQQHVDEHFALPDKRRGRRNGQFTFNRSQKFTPPPANMTSDIEHFRMSLPTYQLRKELLNIINTHKVTLITGGTGCGKTTQVPQFILEEACSANKSLRIMCTQPRRLPAIAVSKRVAVERGERLGSTVGYHIRLEQRTSPETVLTYCTSGVLLRMLTVDEYVSDMTHIILDEIHEREQNTDYLLIALKQALRKRDDLKIILMSATMEGNINTFMNYFDSTAVGYINIPSRLYNVEKFDLADVLALTGYMPRSIFGGLFSASIGFGHDTQPQTCTYDTFPQVGEFRSEEKIYDSSTFYPNCSQSQLPSTEPNLMNCYGNPSSSTPYQPSPQQSGFGNSGGFSRNFAEKRARSPLRNTGGFGSYGFSSQQPRNMSEAAQHLDQILPNRPRYFDPKIVHRLRNAELSRGALISTYLNSGGQQWTDSVDVDLTVELIRYIANCQIDGAILVFLPGFEDIVQVRDQMAKVLSELREKPVIFTLHSQINSQEQQKVFDKVPAGCRKIILSTNIAEASLTINDVVFVIDCGKVKEKTYDHNTRITQLKVAWIAKSNAEQRAGRAGRCRNGYCFRLYSKREYDSMLETQIPEMKRSAIHDVCLHAKMFAPENMSVKRFLEMAPEPPPPLAVDHSMDFLEQLGALYTDKEKLLRYQQQHQHERFIDPSRRNYNSNNNAGFGHNSFGTSRDTSAEAFFGLSMAAAAYAASANHHASSPTPRGDLQISRESLEPELTELGRVLAHLPLEPQLSRLLLFGLALKCFNPVVTLVASLSHRDPFVLPMGDERTAAINARDEFGRRDFSDHLMLIRAFYAYSLHSNRQYNFCRSNFLSPQAMKMISGIRRQLILELKRLHFLPPNVTNHDDPEVNLYSNCWPMIQGAIVAGCYPGIGFVKAGSKLRKIRTSTDQNASLHPSSVIKRQILNVNRRSELINRYAGDNGDPVIEYLAYQELSKIDEGLTLRMVTVVPPLSVLLFAGPIRTTKEIVENFEIAEEDIPPEVLRDDVTFTRNAPFLESGHPMDENPSDSTESTSAINVIPYNVSPDSRTFGCRHYNFEVDNVEGTYNLTVSDFPTNVQRFSATTATSAVASSSCVMDSTNQNGQNDPPQPEEFTSTSIIVEHVGDFAPRGDSFHKRKCRPSASAGDVTTVDPSIFGSHARAIDHTPEFPEGCIVGEEEDSPALELPEEPEPEYVLELETWLAFKGTFETMQMLARIRFKLMSYFLGVLKNPSRESSREDLKLLECLSQVLSLDHKRNDFVPCDDLPKPRPLPPKVRSVFNRNENHNNNSNGAAASSRNNNNNSTNNHNNVDHHHHHQSGNNSNNCQQQQQPGQSGGSDSGNDNSAYIRMLNEKKQINDCQGIIHVVGDGSGRGRKGVGWN